MIAEATGTGTIAEFLKPLERFGCRRLDGRVIPSSDVQIDHVLIAPPGVFVIGAKSWDGRLEVVDGVLRRDAVAQIDQVAALVSQASAVSGLLDSWTGESISIPVHAVLAFTGPAQIDGWAALSGAHAVDGKSLAEFITKFPAAVGIEHVNWAYQALDDHLPIHIPTAAAPAEATPAAAPSAASVAPLTLVPPIEPELAIPAQQAAPPVVVPPAPAAVHDEPASMAPPASTAPTPPVAVAPPMADATRQAPNEPIVFLSRTSEGGQDRFVVRDEEGYPGGTLDLRTALGEDVTGVAAMVFQQMLPAYLPDQGPAIDDLPLGTQAAIRHYLGTQVAVGGPDDPSVVACVEGHFEGRPRLYASLLQSGGRRTDLGWIELLDRRTHSDVPGVDPILRYCGDAFQAVTPR
jgi:hypothetical protein